MAKASKKRGSASKAKASRSDSAVSAHTRALKRNTQALEVHARALDRHSFALGTFSLEACVLQHLGKTKADLNKPLAGMFAGIVQPIDFIIQECGQDCYALTPRQVYQKIGAHPVNTIRDFITHISV
jgi:hypothetical protein